MEVVRQEVDRWRLPGTRPSIIFLQESAAVSYGTCTQQNFNAKQAKRKRQKKKYNASCLQRELISCFRRCQVPSSILSLSNGSGQACLVLQVLGVCVHRPRVVPVHIGLLGCLLEGH